MTSCVTRNVFVIKFCWWKWNSLIASELMYCYDQLCDEKYDCNQVLLVEMEASELMYYIGIIFLLA
jgi:hypothetical protein